MKHIYRLLIPISLVLAFVAISGCPGVGPSGNLTTPTPSPTFVATTTPTPTPTAHVTATPAANVTPTMNKTNVTPTTNVTVKPTTSPSTAGPKVTVGLTAQNIHYNRSTITVPACSNVTIVFDNKDNGVPHNFALYNTSAAQHAIFTGQIVTGPKVVNYNFKAPCTPGNYFYRCDVHPTIMTGTFVVTPANTTSNKTA